MDRSSEIDIRISAPRPAALLGRLAALLALCLCAGLGVAVWLLPAPDPALPGLVRASLPESGVANPVTAVLLNFRAYDTLLELVVLMLTALAARAVNGGGPWPRGGPPPEADPVLAAFFGVLAPLAIVVAGYVLWVGQHAPGGAFQAGSILGAAGVLAALIGRFPPASGLAWQRALLVFGPAAFLAVGLGAMLGPGSFLQFRAPYAGALILFIETAAAVSIAAVLVSLFLGCLQGPGPRAPREASEPESGSAPGGGP